MKKIEKVIFVVAMIIGIVCKFSFNAYAIEQVEEKYESERKNNINNTLLYLGYGENDEIYSLEYKVESDEKEKSIVFVYEDDKMLTADM